MKKLILILVCLCFMLCGCATGNKETGNDSLMMPVMDADASGLEGRKDVYTLYFRLGDTGYLAPEERVLTVEKDDTPEMALIRSLIAGPAATSADLTPVFPKDTQVLATAKQGSTLFVTLNERFLSGYTAERADGAAEEKQAALRMEKELCLDALAATLTENGLCSRVQILILRNRQQGNSMRLEEDYLLQNGSGLPLETWVRREESLYTPHNAARHMLTLWMNHNFSGLMGCVSSQGKLSGQMMLEAMENSPALTGFSLGHGQVSANGLKAVIGADLFLHLNGNDWTVKGWPLTLEREGGVWKISWESLSSMMAEE